MRVRTQTSIIVIPFVSVDLTEAAHDFSLFGITLVLIRNLHLLIHLIFHDRAMCLPAITKCQQCSASSTEKHAML